MNPVTVPERSAAEDLSMVEALPPEETAPLARRVAGARGLVWQQTPGLLERLGGFRGKFAGKAGRQSVVWATLHKNDGLLGLFADSHLMAAADKSLGQVLRVQPLALPGLHYLGLMVDDRYNALLEAFLLEERRRIYVWDGHSLREVFRGYLLLEQFEHARWQNPKAPAVWRLRRILGDVTLRDGSLVYTRREQRLEAPGSPQEPLPPIGAFQLRDERHEELRYRWNPRLLRFDPA